MGDREFEILIFNLFKEIYPTVKLTKKTRDGGRDVEFVENENGRSLKGYIECKYWKEKVDVKIARELFGVITNNKINKGIIVSVSGFSKDVKKEYENTPHIEFIDKKVLIKMLNTYLPDWRVNFTRYTLEK
jgi:restriction system protein